MHGLGNLVVLGLYLGSWLLRYGDPQQPPGTAIAPAFAGGGLALVTAWLGGELVDRRAVGVDDDAGLNAPSSLRQHRS